MSKKILFGIDEQLNNLENLKAYAHMFNEVFSSGFTAVYLSDFIEQGLSTHPVKGKNVGNTAQLIQKPVLSKELLIAAEKLNINCKVFAEQENTEQLLLRKTSFSDLFLLDDFFLHDYCQKGDDQLYRLLLKIECPVLINPVNLGQVLNILIIFDGTKSSVKAIKDFVYLFEPVVQDKSITVFSMSPETEDEIAQERYLMHYLKSNFKDIGIQITDSEIVEKELTKFIKAASNPLLVMGASGFEPVCESGVINQVCEQHIPVFLSK